VRADSRRHAGFSLLEILISMALVSMLLGVLLPLLANARETSQRDRCVDNLRQLGRAVAMYMDDSDGRFPMVPTDSSWRYAGVRFSSVDQRPFPDTQRPLTAYLPLKDVQQDSDCVLCCPADRNILRADGSRVMRGASVFRTWGTSYRANGVLFRDRNEHSAETPLAWKRSEIATAPSRLVVAGDPIWFELLEETGYDAAWHGDADRGNLLFLDGAVKYMQIRSKKRSGPAVFEPRAKAW
jgi:prepilin-type N-terminal cleavage/methylation domain-containing protein/prepilin-type processing-associated H-X9-DG protein